MAYLFLIGAGRGCYLRKITATRAAAAAEVKMFLNRAISNGAGARASALKKPMLWRPCSSSFTPDGTAIIRTVS